MCSLFYFQYRDAVSRLFVYKKSKFMQDFLADVLLIGSCLFKCFSSVYKCFIPLLFFDRHWCPWDDNCDIGSGQTAECGKKSYEGSHSFCVALNLVCKLNFFIHYAAFSEGFIHRHCCSFCFVFFVRCSYM